MFSLPCTLVFFGQIGCRKGVNTKELSKGDVISFGQASRRWNFACLVGRVVEATPGVSPRWRGGLDKSAQVFLSLRHERARRRLRPLGRCTPDGCLFVGASVRLPIANTNRRRQLVLGNRVEDVCPNRQPALAQTLCPRRLHDATRWKSHLQCTACCAPMHKLHYKRSTRVSWSLTRFFTPPVDAPMFRCSTCAGP